MKRWGLIVVVLMVGFITISSYDSRMKQGNDLPQAAQIEAAQAKVKMDKDYGKMPLIFIPNNGQMDKQVYYYVQGKDKTVYFTSTGLTYSLAGPVERDSSKPSSRWVVKLDFVGARKDVKPELLEKSGTVVSYFKGKPEQWNAGLQAASKILYRDLWPGIDLAYYGTVNKMKYEFIVQPGADPSQIKLAYRGANSVKENSQGQLEVQTPAGGFQDDTPVAWQEIAGKRESLSLKYALESRKETPNTPTVTYGFLVGKYDRNQELILDPAVIVYCGYIGGSGHDYGYGIAVDTSGCAYVVGLNTSTQASFPVNVGPDLTYNGGDDDAFVAKVKADGTGFVYCGYIGGTGRDESKTIAVDNSGCAYIAGFTSSTQTSFPVKVGPDLTNNGGTDAFIAKLKSDGTGLVYCGFIGSTGYDIGKGVAVDTSGSAYVTGYTNGGGALGFPVKIGPDLTPNGGNYDTFVAKINPDGTGLDYCGYIGGSADEYGYVIAADALGCAYITGITSTTQASFPVTVGPDLTFNGGECDAFVARVNAAGTGLDYCGYIGGPLRDESHGIMVDKDRNAYVTGFTYGGGLPVTVGPDLTFNGSADTFIAKIKIDGTRFVYCGYIGGSGSDVGDSVAVDSSNCAYVAGYTNSNETTFPVKNGLDFTYNGGEFDSFVAKIKTDGTGLDYCGYIGGTGNEYAWGIAIDRKGNAYISGYTNSLQSLFPVKDGPDLTENGGVDAFVAKISQDFTVTFTAGSGGNLSGNTTQKIYGGDTCTPVTAVPNSGYFFMNWTGTGGFVATNNNPLTVTDVTSNMVITANFNKITTGWVPLEGLQNHMIVYGKAYNGNNSVAVGDWIGAFGPGGVSDCRAVAAVQANGNYYITIGSNKISNEMITFKLWPLPSGPSIDSSESVNFIADYVYSGLPLHFGYRVQSFQLVNGWNWISFNVQPANISFNSVFGTPGVIEQVKNQNQAAIYTGENWIGDLTDMSEIANGIMYKVKTNQAYAFNVTGMTVPYNTPLSLITGWNWTGYLPTLTQPVNAAVNSIITPMSQVKSQDKSVIKSGASLYGDLTEMEPNKGYAILMNATGTLVYPFGVSASPDQPTEKTAAKVQAVSWPVIKGNQYNMVAVGKVYFEGKVVNTTGYYLASIGPKGENDGRSINPVKTDGSYFATILGNTAGETVKFKLINSTIGKTYDVAGSLEFQPDNLKTGFDLKARSVKITAPVEGANLQMGAVYNISWDAYEINNVKIELYKCGKSFTVIAPSVPAASHTYNWTIPDRLSAGNDYQVKVTCVDPGAIAKDLSKTFSIKPAPSITLISPNGGEKWKVKQSVDITWSSNGIGNIKIELYNGKVLKTVIAASTPAATGKYTWAIPANHALGTKFKIKISSVDAGLNLNDTSDSWFSIKL